MRRAAEVGKMDFLKLDFTDPKKWQLIANVLQYESSESWWEEYGSWAIDEMQSAHDVKSMLPIWHGKQIKENQTKNTRNYKKGTCDHCGAHFCYGGAFKNLETGQIAIVGNICASTVLNLTIDGRADKLLRKKIKSAKTRHENKIAREQRLLKIETFDADLKAAILLDNYVCKSIKQYYLNTGDITDRQKTLLIKLLEESRAVQEKLPAPRKIAVEEGKGVEITGSVISIKWKEGFAFNSRIMMMLVESVKGFRIYGTVPKSLIVEDLQPGDKISFTANVEKSEKDESFGFFKRPRKAKRN